jgi:hypothetical protein
MRRSPDPDAIKQEIAGMDRRHGANDDIRASIITSSQQAVRPSISSKSYAEVRESKREKKAAIT